MEQVLEKEKKFQMKLAEYKKNPDDMKLNREIAILYIKRQQFDKAEPISKKMPDDSELNGQFALTYLELNHLEKAEPYSEKVFADDPENETGLIPELRSKLGLAYVMQLQRKPNDSDLLKKAETHLQVVIDNFQESDEYEPSQYYLGVAFHINKQFEKAITVFENLLNHGKNEQLLRNVEVMLKRSQDSLESTPKTQ